MNTGLEALDTDENEFGNAKYEEGPDAHCTVENEFGSVKHENYT
jgi:hypothetical protein